MLALLVGTCLFGACARVSGLADLTKDDCAFGCSDATTDEAPRDAASDGDADDDAASRVEVACGDVTCPPGTPCCYPGDGGPPSCLARGCVDGVSVACDDDRDCRVLSSQAACCGDYGATSSRFRGTLCRLAADACATPLCGVDAGCRVGGPCVPIVPGGPRACQPDAAL